MLKGIRTKPTQRTVVRREVEERREGSVVLRRTTIEELRVEPESRDEPRE